MGGGTEVVGYAVAIWCQWIGRRFCLHAGDARRSTEPKFARSCNLVIRCHERYSRSENGSCDPDGEKSSPGPVLL